MEISGIKKWQNWIVGLVLVLSFCYLLIWVVTIPFNSAPDEELRYMLPTFIYKNWFLPTGYHDQVVYREGYYSYAFYPQWLGPITSALFMKMDDIVSIKSIKLFHFARMTSVCAGLGVSYVLGITSQRLTNKFSFRIFAMILVVSWPQLTFLSSYINNDIIGLLGATILLDSMVKLWKEKNWKLKSTFQVGIGYVICLLGYVNTYPLILCSAFYFIMLLKRVQVKRGYKLYWLANHCLTLSIFVLILAFPFFLRNYLLYSDWLGNNVFEARNQLWVAQGNSPTLFPFEGTFLELLFASAFWESTLMSAIGVFGYMDVYMTDWDYRFYLLFIFLGIGSSLASWSFRLLTKRLNKDDFALIISIFTTCLLTVFLVLYRALYVDYQAQGRYLMIAIIPLFLMALMGYESIFLKFPKWLKIASGVIFLLLLLYYAGRTYYQYIYLPYIGLDW